MCKWPRAIDPSSVENLQFAHQARAKDTGSTGGLPIKPAPCCICSFVFSSIFVLGGIPFKSALSSIIFVGELRFKSCSPWGDGGNAAGTFAEPIHSRAARDRESGSATREVPLLRRMPGRLPPQAGSWEPMLGPPQF